MAVSNFGDRTLETICFYQLLRGFLLHPKLPPLIFFSINSHVLQKPLDQAWLAEKNHLCFITLDHLGDVSTQNVYITLIKTWYNVHVFWLYLSVSTYTHKVNTNNKVRIIVYWTCELKRAEKNTWRREKN